MARPHNRTPLLAYGDLQLVNAAFHTKGGLPHGRGMGLAFQFDFGGLLALETVYDLQMYLIKQIYVPYMQYIAKAAATIAVAQAFQAWLGGQNLDGIITGASLSINIFYAAPSAIEGENLNPDPGQNQVYLIGPDQINGAGTVYQNVVNYVNNLAKNPPKSLSAANKQYQKFKSFFAKQNGLVQCLINESNQNPDSSPLRQLHP